MFCYEISQTNELLPAFTLCQGEHLSLNFPSDYDQKEEARITQI